MNTSLEPTLYKLIQKVIYIYWSSSCAVMNELSLCVLLLVILATKLVVITVIWMCLKFNFRIINKNI